MRHHFVPRFLLSGWCVGNGDSKLEEFRVDLPGLPSVRRVPKGTGYQHDLYALTNEEVAGMDQHDVETIILRRIDNDAARVRVKIITQGLKSLSTKEQSAWIQFLMAQRLRHPEIIAKIKFEGAERFGEELANRPEEYASIATEGDPPTLQGYVQQHWPGLTDNFGLTHLLPKLIGDTNIGNMLLHMRWWLCDLTKGKHDLLLADNPCIFTGSIDAAELAVAIPIAPRTVFVLTRGDAVTRRIATAPPTLLAARLNQSSVSQARARLYARNQTPRRFIENHLGKLGRC